MFTSARLARPYTSAANRCSIPMTPEIALDVGTTRSPGPSTDDRTPHVRKRHGDHLVIRAAIRVSRNLMYSLRCPAYTSHPTRWHRVSLDPGQRVGWLVYAGQRRLYIRLRESRIAALITRWSPWRLRTCGVRSSVEGPGERVVPTSRAISGVIGIEQRFAAEVYGRASRAEVNIGGGGLPGLYEQQRRGITGAGELRGRCWYRSRRAAVEVAAEVTTAESPQGIAVPADRVGHGEGDVGMIQAEPVGHPQDLPADLIRRQGGDESGGVPGGANSTLRPVQPVGPAGNPVVDDEIGQRWRGLQGAPQRVGAPSVFGERRRVQSGRQTGCRRPRAGGPQQVEGAQRGLSAGGVIVEGHHHACARPACRQRFPGRHP